MKRFKFFSVLLLIHYLHGSSGSVTLGDDQPLSVAEILFADDAAVLADNRFIVTKRITHLPARQKFESLANWILPSRASTEFRMSAEFLQTDPVPGSLDRVKDAMCEGIFSPVFVLVRAAEESGRLDELRQRIEAIPEPGKPHQLRAKLALLLIVHCAQGHQEDAASLCVRLAQEVRVRADNMNGEWWPETLALAWGMPYMQNRTELLELATSIYDPQIGHNLLSGKIAWDIFVAGCYARLQVEKPGASPASAGDQNVFELWRPASVVTANSRGNGYPTEVWQRQGSAIHKCVGHDNDYLYFPVPLTGNFEVDCDVSSFYYRETQVAYAGLYASHYWKIDEAEIGGIRSHHLIPLKPPLTNPDDWLTCRIVVKDGVCQHFISGRLVLERTISEGHSPWLALRTFRLGRGSMRNLIITGTPSIPTDIAMLVDQDLEGWFAYFEEPVADANYERSWRYEATADGTGELIHPATHELAGSAAESLLLYHRPMMEDGVIEYEFYYEPGKSMVHPAVDRMSFLLEPDGVKVHWITDGKYQSSDLSPYNVSPPLNVGVSHDQNKIRPLPLIANAWNNTKVAVKGDEIQIHLNGELIGRTSLDKSNRRQFGLFHFADQSSVRVRKMHWTGDWPKAMNPSIFPPTVRPDVATIDKAVDQFAQSYRHDFRHSKLPRGAFSKKRGPIEATDKGVVTESSSEGNWQQTDLSVSLEIGGDFDLRASFKDLTYSATGNLGAQLMSTLAGTGQEIRIARNRWDQGPEMMKFQIGSTKVNGRWEYSDTWTKLASTEGIFRLVRLSDKLHFLFAESEISGFRLLHTEKVGKENLRLGDTSLSVFVDKIGKVSCLWTDLRIRAERLSGTALLNSEAILTTLNDEREKLPIHLLFDFEKDAPQAADFYRNSDEPAWNLADKGLILESVGQEGWVASMLGSRKSIEGDFDVTLSLGETDLVVPIEGRYSSLMWQIQQQSNDGTRFASMLLRTPTEYKAIAQQHRTLPDGNHEYTWHGEVEVAGISKLRIARRGKVYTMLARLEGAELDEAIHQIEHLDGPILLHCLLHTGTVGKTSRVVLKSIEIAAEVYNRPAGVPVR